MRMKRIFSIGIIALLGIAPLSACVKKAVMTVDRPLTVIVMDTTQALLDGAKVTVGKTVLTTSFDGRVVLKPELLAKTSSFNVEREGFKRLEVRSLEVRRLEVNDSTIIVRLTPTGEKAHVGKGYGRKGVDGIYYSMGSPRSSKYEKAGLSLATADFAVAEEEVAFLAVEGGSAPMMANNNVSAGRLTAGEVNDFAKWYFWPSVLDSSHAKFVKTWGIEPRQRYTVQVMTKDGHPVVNYPVNLTDERGNTIFQAVTDNTGKAELWGGLVQEFKSSKVQEFKIREPEKTIILDEPCDHTDDVDVCFVFDATGSMGDELRYLQAEMKDVIARASNATGGLNIRTGAVVYRDHGDEYITRISRLTDDIKTTQAFIDKQEANGGGDYEEAVPEALMAALNSAGWNESARARIAFLILDAPCHEDSATLALLHEQILNAAALGVRIVPVVCSGIGESGEYLLRAMALATNGTSFFLTDDSGIGHSHLKPTTDSLKVEHLNDMLVRTIVEFSMMPACSSADANTDADVDEQFIPNPFSAQELEKDPTIPHGEGIHYLVDISGKLITILEGDIDTIQSQISRLGLPVGIYFIKTYVDGKWITKKILVR